MLMLDKFSRFPLIDATPIEHLSRLSNLLKGPQIYVKRDDLNVLGGGGNKLRKLEFFVGEAINQKADTLITVGALQSNHARLTAAAAAKAGLSCELVLVNKVPRSNPDYQNNGNLLLNKIFGAKMHLLSKQDNVEQFIQDLKDKLKTSGKTPYFVPLGGSNALGSLGYVKCAGEIVEYSQTNKCQFNYVTVVNGSAGTHAGLIAGFKAHSYSTTTIGYTVVRSVAETLPYTLELVNQCLHLFASNLSVSSADIILDDKYVGEGYGLPTAAMKEAMYLMGQTEGLILDPVYTGKAFAGVIADIRNGKFTNKDNILFIMTGGAPGVHAYQDVFSD